MRIYDPQSGTIYEDRDYRDFIRTHIQYKSTSYGMKIEHPIDVLRVDNLEFNTEIVDQIVTEKQ